MYVIAFLSCLHLYMYIQVEPSLLHVCLVYVRLCVCMYLCDLLVVMFPQGQGCVDTNCLLATAISTCSSVMSSSTLTDLSVLMRRCVAMATSYTASYVNGTQSAKTVTAEGDFTPPHLIVVTFLIPILLFSMLYITLLLLLSHTLPYMRHSSPSLFPSYLFAGVSELLQALSCHQLPSEHTVKNIVSDIVWSTV